MALLLCGLTNRGIALKTLIWKNTARRPLKLIFAKRGVDYGGTAAVIMAISTRILLPIFHTTCVATMICRHHP